MQSGSDRFTSRSYAAAAFFACLVAAGFLWAESVATPSLFSLHFNPFALLSGLSTALTLLVLVRMVQRGGHSEEVNWFMLVMLSVIVFSGGEVMQRLSANPSAAVFWSQLSGFGIVLIPIGLYLFAAAYTRPSTARPGIATPIMLTVATVVAFFYVASNLIFNNDPTSAVFYPWGYNTPPGPSFSLLLAWAFIPSFLAVMMLLRFWHVNRDVLLRKQALLYAIAIALPIVGGAITDGILPLLGINILPPLATGLESVMVIIIFYGISRYRFFQINPAILADNVLKTMNEAVIVTRPDYAIEFVNEEAERLIGQPSSEIATGYIHRLFTPDSWPKIHSYISGGKQITADLGDVSIINRAGQLVPVRVYTSHLMEGDQFEAYIFVISDITDITESYNKLESDAARISHLLDESHRLERQLEEEKAGVERTVEVRTRELRQAQERLKAADELKNEFMLLSAHNLRTPITVMMGSVEMLKGEGKGKGKTGDRAYFLTALEQNIYRLRDFVEDMVAITSLESGSALELANVSAGEVLEPLVGEFKGLAQTKPEIKFSHSLESTGATLHANTARLQAAVRNLVANAFKFTKTGTVTLKAKAHEGKFIITVADTGIGIDPKEVDRLFTKFHRGTDTIRFEYEGEGIGLYLTKLIVTEHDGTIGVESVLGKGSAFTITIPLAPQK
jgi:PAS domain S-box-containing protein